MHADLLKPLASLIIRNSFTPSSLQKKKVKIKKKNQPKHKLFSIAAATEQFIIN